MKDFERRIDALEAQQARRQIDPREMTSCELVEACLRALDLTGNPRATAEATDLIKRARRGLHFKQDNWLSESAEFVGRFINMEAINEQPA